MQLIQNILIATDLTKSSKIVIDTAITLSKKFHSNIYLIYVFPEAIKDEKSKSMIEEAATSKMDEIVKSIESEDVVVKETFLRNGNCVEAVVRTADRINANLILIGSGELAKNEIYKLGTTADMIIRKSEVPVWVVQKGSKVQIKRIFCPIDFSDQSKRALTDAAYIARSFKASLVIFSVYELYDKSFPRFNPESGGMNKLFKTEHENRLKKFIENIEINCLDYTLVIKAGDPAKEILKAIKKLEPDLLLMGTSGKSGISRWLMGSVAEKVTREVPCSFVTVKSKEILTLELEHRVIDMEYHFKAAETLAKKGLFKEAADQFLICLKINDMHIPSMAGISKAYESLGNKQLAESYKNMARNSLGKMWDKKIEAEIRQHYSL